MELNLNCLGCNINQALKITEILETEGEIREKIIREVLEYLSTTDYKRTNMEVVTSTWEIIVKHIHNEDPYKAIKRYYNHKLDQLSPAIKHIVDSSSDKFNTALKISIIGNIIDYNAKHFFTDEMLLYRITSIHYEQLTIDDSEKLHEKLKHAKSLLYIGDNCGEIVLDRIFIEAMKELFPDLHVYFGVKGKPIVNDATFEDATMVRMDQIAEIIDSGDGSFGTVIAQSNDLFKEKFWQADVIIAKGQCNYESLHREPRSNMFFLFMAKCDVIATLLDVKETSIICKESFYE
jgi:uncharacterized protein with ATP-grasp and redox domains